jgi:hypothetical protein
VKHTILFCVLLALATPAAADDGPRDFSPDRPARSDSPFTVPLGMEQIESDLLNYTHTGGMLQTLDPTLKYGVTNLIDAEILIGGLITQRGDGTHATSFGDIVVRAKISLVGDDGGPVTAALIPYIKIPTARAPIGNGQVEGGLNAPVQFALPWDVSLTAEPEISVLKNALNDGKQASFTGIVNLGRKIIGDLSGFVEIYAQTYTDRATAGPDVTFDYGLAYLVTKNIQLDAGANLGLNARTPSLNLYTGVAFRF